MIESTDELLDLLNPSNPLTSYIYLVIIAITLRIFLIIFPLYKALGRFGRKGILSRLLKLRNVSSVDGIFWFLLKEVFWLELPLSIAFIWRLIEGQPENLDWSMMQLSIALICGLMWVLVDIRRTLDTNKKLKILSKWYTNPRAVNLGLDSILSSRSILDSLSKMDIEHPDELDIEYTKTDSNPVLVRNEEGKIERIDTDVLAQKAEVAVENAGVFLKKAAHLAKEKMAIGKEGIKAGADSSRDRLDNTLQAAVDDIIDKKRTPVWDVIANVIMSVYPLCIIYYLLPLLGA
jgi:hypothetical protein